MPKTNYFPKVKEAREALKDRAIEILETYLAVIGEAREAKEFDVATKSLQWLIEHLPDDEGTSVVNISVDKPKVAAIGPTGPTINIGFKLGGRPPTKFLPEPTKVIDITPDTDE